MSHLHSEKEFAEIKKRLTKQDDANIKSMERHSKTLGKRQTKSWGMSTKYTERPDMLRRKQNPKSKALESVKTK